MPGTGDKLQEQALPDDRLLADFPELQPGDLIDNKIEVLDLIGSGGQATVYKARHLTLERTVALKVLHDTYAGNAVALQRWQRECSTIGKLSHPGIVSLLGAGVLPGERPYLIMEFVDGVSLAQLLATGNNLAAEHFFTIFHAVTGALTHAHQHGIVHLDVKPGNILVCTNDSGTPVGAKLVDFGLARMFEGSDVPGSAATRTAAVRGTSAYMSPEQCTGGPVDQRSDIYSLGCVMCQSLTGRAPFMGESDYEVMYKHLHDSLSRIVDLKSLPLTLRSIITKCLAKEPDKRYETVEQLSADLRRCEVNGVDFISSIREEKSGPCC